MAGGFSDTIVEPHLDRVARLVVGIVSCVHESFIGFQKLGLDSLVELGL